VQVKQHWVLKYQHMIMKNIHAEKAHKNCLQLYIEDPKKYGDHLQLWMLSDTKCRLALAQRDPKQICVIDRSEWGNRVFANVNYYLKNITDAGMEFYYAVCTKHLPNDIDLILFVYEPPKVCMERTNHRNYKDEDKYTIDYFEKLDEFFFQSLIETNIPFIVLFSSVCPTSIEDVISSLTCERNKFPTLQFAIGGLVPEKGDFVIHSKSNLIKKRITDVSDNTTFWIDYDLKKDNDRAFKNCVFILLSQFHSIIFYYKDLE